MRKIGNYLITRIINFRFATAAIFYKLSYSNESN